MSQRILIIGGHGKVALLATPLLTERGHHVTSVIRNPDHRADVASAGATAVVADVEQLDTAGLREVIAGHDVVVWSAGAGGGNPQRTHAVDQEAATRSMTAATQAGVRRYVMVSYFGARVDHGVPADNSFHAYATAKATADEHLRGSGLDWTILGPSGLTLDAPTGRIAVNRGNLTGGTVTRADVAAVIAETIARDDTIGRTIEFNNGDEPILPDALDR